MSLLQDHIVFQDDNNQPKMQHSLHSVTIGYKKEKFGLMVIQGICNYSCFTLAFLATPPPTI